MNKLHITESSLFKGTSLERYHSIYPIIGKTAQTVVSNLKGRGRNSWKTVQANIQLVNSPTTSQLKEYYNLIDQDIDLDEDYYTNEDFTNIVCSAMFKLGMQPFESRIASKCEDEMFKLFLWEDVYSEPLLSDEKPVFIGYKPICRLKA
jgi:hypothetical protein